MSWTKQILITVSLVIFSINPSFGVWKENAKAIDISGGEDHTLVLGENGNTFGCGDNSSYQLGIGDSTNEQFILVTVHSGDMNTASGWLENIADIDAGWTHSLALDANNNVWAWGNNGNGQLGNGETC